MVFEVKIKIEKIDVTLIVFCPRDAIASINAKLTLRNHHLKANSFYTPMALRGDEFQSLFTFNYVFDFLGSKDRTVTKPINVNSS